MVVVPRYDSHTIAWYIQYKYHARDVTVTGGLQEPANMVVAPMIPKYPRKVILNPRRAKLKIPGEIDVHFTHYCIMNRVSVSRLGLSINKIFGAFCPLGTFCSIGAKEPPSALLKGFHGVIPSLSSPFYNWRYSGAPSACVNVCERAYVITRHTYKYNQLHSSGKQPARMNTEDIETLSGMSSRVCLVCRMMERLNCGGPPFALLSHTHPVYPQSLAHCAHPP